MIEFKERLHFMSTFDCSGVARTSIGWWEAQPFITLMQRGRGAAGQRGRKADGQGRGGGQGGRAELGSSVWGHAGMRADREARGNVGILSLTLTFSSIVNNVITARIFHFM